MEEQDPKGYHIYFTDDVPEDVFVDEVETELPVDDSQPGNPASWGPHPPFRKPSEDAAGDGAVMDEPAASDGRTTAPAADADGIPAEEADEPLPGETDEAETADAGEEADPGKDKKGGKGKKEKKKKGKDKPEGGKPSLFARLFKRRKA